MNSNNFNDRTMALAMRMRELLVSETTTIGDGQAAALTALWTLIRDEASNRSMEPDQVLREKVDWFLKTWAPNIRIVPRGLKRLNS
jgi:hypothetical protein